jgi:hypothetical protein
MRRRRCRNGVHGTTERDREHLRGNPRRPKGSGVLLGHLTELVLHDGRTMGPSKLKGCFLGWVPRTDDFCVVKKVGKASTSALSARDRSVFKQFHQTPVKTAGLYDWPSNRGLRQIGRLKSLTYVVPEWVKSPQKRGYRWVHEFGDHGERGHGSHDGFKGYSTRLMPVLCKAGNGSLHIKRMPGNKYDVTAWIYW